MHFIVFKCTTVFDACCTVMFPFVLLANSSIRLNHSRILVQNEEFFPKVCTNAEDRRTITRIHSRSWAGFSIATDETERDLKAVACQQVQHSSWRASFPDARTLAISRGFLASAIPVVTHETLEVFAHESAGNARLTWVACRARSPLAFTSTY